MTESSHSLVEPRLDTASRLESCDRGLSVSPPSPHHTPSPTSLQQQGTPTEWTPSNRGSPVAPDETNTIDSKNGIKQHDEPDDLPTTLHLCSDTDEHAMMDIAIASDSLQPPTPAQRIKHSPLPRSSSFPCSRFKMGNDSYRYHCCIHLYGY